MLRTLNRPNRQPVTGRSRPLHYNMLYLTPASIIGGLFMGRHCTTPCPHGAKQKKDCYPCYQESNRQSYLRKVAFGKYYAGKTRETYLEDICIKETNNRAKRFGVPGILTIEQFRFLKSQPCTYCKSTKFHIEIDHRIPMSKGGSNEPDNLQPVCKFCNRSKSTFSEREFLVWLLHVRSAESQVA